MTLVHQSVVRTLLEQYRQIATSTLGHFTDAGYLPGITSRFGPKRLLGRAFTVRLTSTDGSAIREALITAQPGDVLVIDMGNETDRACWGELRSRAAIRKQLAGIVTNGCATDSEALKRLEFPVFAKGISAITTRPEGPIGQIHQPIKIGGTLINSGDLVIGDEDGLFVLPLSTASDLAQPALEKQAAERSGS